MARGKSRARQKVGGIPVIRDDFLLAWRMRGATWRWDFNGGLLRRNDRPVTNLTGTEGDAIRYSVAYEQGWEDRGEV